jgi:hypothetical protein
MADLQDNQTSVLKVTRQDLTDPEVYRLNQVIGHLQSQINEIRRDARLYGNLQADSITAKLVDGIPGDNDVIPWGTIKRFLSHLQEIILVANTTINASVLAVEGDLLIQYITQGAGPYTINFDPAEFAVTALPSTGIGPEDGSSNCFLWLGRSDGLWWPISWPLIGMKI